MVPWPPHPLSEAAGGAQPARTGCVGWQLSQLHSWAQVGWTHNSTAADRSPAGQGPGEMSFPESSRSSTEEGPDKLRTWSLTQTLLYDLGRLPINLCPNSTDYKTGTQLTP